MSRRDNRNKTNRNLICELSKASRVRFQRRGANAGTQKLTWPASRKSWEQKPSPAWTGNSPRPGLIANYGPPCETQCGHASAINPEGCQRVAGGRSAAQTTGSNPKNQLHPEAGARRNNSVELNTRLKLNLPCRSTVGRVSLNHELSDSSR